MSAVAIADVSPLAEQASAVAATRRMDSVDFLRGLVMVIMAIDHVRDFFTNVRFDPLDPSQTWPALFMTRWITHFCAPIFVFLAGTGAYFAGTRRTTGELSRFLLTRGIWLVILEHTFVRFGWFFNFDYSILGAQVIWAIGWSMIVLALLVHLPVRVITVFGVLMIALHNAFDPITPAQLGEAGWVWNLLHEGGIVPISRGLAFFFIYPLVPWIGVMAAGYGFGALLREEPARRRKLLLILGASMILLFIVLRATNLYGDAKLWSAQKSPLFTLFSFIDVTKYPPSLLFLLMTLGPAIVLLSFLPAVMPPAAKPLIVFGRVPLFYYVLHLSLIHALAVFVQWFRGGPIAWMFANPPAGSFLAPPDGYGYGLPGVYAAWALVILLLYPACYWFAGLKSRRRDAWLSYM